MNIEKWRKYHQLQKRLLEFEVGLIIVTCTAAHFSQPPNLVVKVLGIITFILIFAAPLIAGYPIPNEVLRKLQSSEGKVNK